MGLSFRFPDFSDGMEDRSAKSAPACSATCDLGPARARRNQTQDAIRT